MAVLLQFDYNKRLGLPAFSSHSFGITMKAEVTDLAKIGEEAERAYGLLQSAVDAQIVHSGYVSNEDKERSMAMYARPIPTSGTAP